MATISRIEGMQLADLKARANIDYGFAEANTTYGKVGVKVWVYHGEVLPTKETKEGSDK